MPQTNPASDPATATDTAPLPRAQSEDLARRLDFIIAADALRNVERRTYIGDGSRHENSAEHSWHLAVLCFCSSPSRASGI